MNYERRVSLSVSLSLSLSTGTRCIAGRLQCVCDLGACDACRLELFSLNVCVRASQTSNGAWAGFTPRRVPTLAYPVSQRPMLDHRRNARQLRRELRLSLFTLSGRCLTNIKRGHRLHFTVLGSIQSCGHFMQKHWLETKGIVFKSSTTGQGTRCHKGRRHVQRQSRDVSRDASSRRRDAN